MKISFKYKDSLHEDWHRHVREIDRYKLLKINQNDPIELARLCQQEFIKRAGYYSGIEVLDD